MYVLDLILYLWKNKFKLDIRLQMEKGKENQPMNEWMHAHFSWSRRSHVKNPLYLPSNLIKFLNQI